MRMGHVGMASVLAAAAVAVWAGFTPARGAPDEEGKAATATVADLAWLEGNWRRSAGGHTFDELWTSPEGDAMAAVSRQVDGGKTKMFELSSIETTGTGLVLRVRHFGAGLAPWKSEADALPSWALASRAEREAVFESPSHDFPKRITYRRETGKDGAPDVLVAKLEGEQRGKPAAMEFRLTRVAGR